MCDLSFFLSTHNQEKSYTYCFLYHSIVFVSSFHLLFLLFCRWLKHFVLMMLCVCLSLSLRFFFSAFNIHRVLYHHPLFSLCVRVFTPSLSVFVCFATRLSFSLVLDFNSYRCARIATFFLAMSL